MNTETLAAFLGLYLGITIGVIILGGLTRCWDDTDRTGARIILFSPLWPIGAVWLLARTVITLFHEAELTPTKPKDDSPH